MRQAWIPAVLVGLWAAGTASAQELKWQFRWQKGQVLSYKVEHVTAVAETVEGNKVQSASKLNLLKRWQVIDVEPNGAATLQLTLAAMRNEQTRPNGDVLLFDSANPDKSTPELKEAMSKFIGQPLAIIRMDGFGRILEVKQGSKSRFEAEPPFVAVFPNAAAATGQSWVRPFDVTLDPPHGTGEKFEAMQRYQCAKLEGGKATLTLATQMKQPPESPKDQVPLLQKLGEGQMVFDLTAGRLLSVNLQIDRTVQNHQGEGSSYRFQSRYSEELVEAK